MTNIMGKELRLTVGSSHQGIHKTESRHLKILSTKLARIPICLFQNSNVYLSNALNFLKCFEFQCWLYEQCVYWMWLFYVYQEKIHTHLTTTVVLLEERNDCRSEVDCSYSFIVSIYFYIFFYREISLHLSQMLWHDKNLQLTFRIGETI